MAHETALFCCDIHTSNDVLKAAAEAAREQNTHLAVLMFAKLPLIPLGAYGAVPYGSIAIPDGWPETLKTAQKDLHAHVDATKAIMSNAGTSADIRPLLSEVGSIRHTVALSARTCDVAYLAANLREADGVFNEMLYGVLFQSPIGAMINAAPAAAQNRIMLAWNDSLSSSRAAHLARRRFRDAKEVHVVCFDAPAINGGNKIEPGREVASWLSHHGCNVTLTQRSTGGQDVGTCILEHAGEIGADLLVAGAYGHSRFRQAMFGGTSRILSEQTDIPVFMAH